MKSGTIRTLIILVALTVIGLGGGAARAFAEQTVTVNDINAGLIGEEDFYAGQVLIPRIPVFWTSDEPWRITVRSLEPELFASDDGIHIKSLDDLMWKLSDEEIWVQISQDPEEIDWSMESGSGVVYIDLIVELDWLLDPAGTYRLDLAFNIEAL